MSYLLSHLPIKNYWPTYKLDNDRPDWVQPIEPVAFRRTAVAGTPTA